MTLSFDPDGLILPQGHFIGGERIPARDTLPMRRPSDAAVYADCPVAGADTVDRAAEAAKRTLKSNGWSNARLRERMQATHRWADLIEAEVETLARLEAVASTRPVSQLIDGDIACGQRADGLCDTHAAVHSRPVQGIHNFLPPHGRRASAGPGAGRAGAGRLAAHARARLIERFT